ncbi:MAG: hypothetical protein JWM93_893 [Frankiales bacterium]|nr:hypothetical protein [Frankiales bacterium]
MLLGSVSFGPLMTVPSGARNLDPWQGQASVAAGAGSTVQPW